MIPVLAAPLIQPASGGGPPPWTPASLGGLALWLDASDIASMTIELDGGVSQWRDKSGANNHASQADPANYPLYGANMMGTGKPGLDFKDGSQANGGSLVLTSAINLGANPAGSIVIVGALDDITTTAAHALLGSSASSTANMIGKSNAATTERYAIGTSAATHAMGWVLGANEWRAVTRPAGASQIVTVTRNNAAWTTSAAGSPASTSYDLVGANASGIWQGRAALILVGTQVWSAGDFTNLAAYIAARWS